MADTNTTNLNLTKPEVGASTDTWGNKINSNSDTLDGLFTTGPALRVLNGGTGATSASDARTNLGVGTGDSPQFAAVNVGHATDTTITRSTAGVIAVEGGIVPKEDRANTFSASQSVSVADNSNAALLVNQTGSGNALRVTNSGSGHAIRVSQTGSGYALLVEDEAEPDNTPFLVDASGRVVIGTTTPLTYSGAIPQSQQVGTSYSTSAVLNARFQSASGGVPVLWAKARGTTASPASVAADDNIAEFIFLGTNDANTPALTEAALITASIDGSPTETSVPGRITFSTAASGSASATERMRIDSAGRVGIGGTTSAGQTVRVARDTTGAATAVSVAVNSTIKSDVTTKATAYRSNLSTQAESFTLPELQHFEAVQGTVGVASAITTQYGFAANSSLTGATTNYGFYGNLASANGRWNFYAAGTAPNYFAGDIRSNTVVTQSATAASVSQISTLTAANLIGGIVTSTATASGATLTLPTGTNVDSAFQELQVNQAFEWSVINLGSYYITMAANTGHTIVGNASLYNLGSGRFLTRKTAANTFVTYRIA